MADNTGRGRLDSPGSGGEPSQPGGSSPTDASPPQQKKRRVLVYHSYYGCDTGCCGHIVRFEDEDNGHFDFGHPYGKDRLEWAKELLRETLGEDHVADLDWSQSVIVDD